MSGTEKKLNTKKILPDTVKMYYHTEKLFIHVLKMLRSQACVPVLKIISSLQKWS